MPAMEPEPEQPPKALFVPEPALNVESEQVQEPATLSLPVGVLAEYESKE